jgi:hypothetical protein
VNDRELRTVNNANQRVPMRRTAALAWAGIACAFAVLVSANSGGYRYGVSDQAFYIPVFSDAADPALFPRDGALLDSQSRLTVLDELAGALIRATGVSLPALCLIGYLVTVAIFVAGVVLIGDRLLGSAWTTTALVAALTLRHRIAETGVNTFEGYFHPRVLAFGIGLLAVALVLRRTWSAAVLLTAAAIVVHPTTGGWFAVLFILGTLLGRSRGWRTPVLLAVAAVAGIAGVYGVADWRPALLPRMDAEWLGAVSSKDYLFPTTWSPGTWLTNAIAPVVLFIGYRMRARRGCVTAEERTIAFGCMALVGVFLATLPFVASALAVAVQLQISRVLWPVELMATVYLLWMVVERTGERSRAGGARALAVLLLVLSAARGFYILNVQFDRPLVQIDLPRTDWQAMCDWASRSTPVDAGFLADPQHSNRYGVSFRVAARRDVLVEAVKDTAIGIYSRDIALRVRDRVRAAGAFDQLALADIQRLARLYDMDYVITERTYPLPLVHAVGPLRAYRIHDSRLLRE